MEKTCKVCKAKGNELLVVEEFAEENYRKENNMIYYEVVTAQYKVFEVEALSKVHAIEIFNGMNESEKKANLVNTSKNEIWSVYMLGGKRRYKMKTKYLNLRIDEEIIDKLKFGMDHSQREKSDFIRFLIKKYYNENKEEN